MSEPIMYLDLGETVAPLKLLIWVRVLIDMYPGDKIKGIKLIRAMPNNSYGLREAKVIYEYCEGHSFLSSFDPSAIY